MGVAPFSSWVFIEAIVLLGGTPTAALEVIHITSLLEDLGFLDGTGYLLPAIVKFWFTNALGPLTVYPKQCATLALHDRVTSPATKRLWQRPQADFSFCVPISSTKGRITRKQKERYGSAKARQVFLGGGPFMLQDSESLVAQSLERLGYLDADLNNDFSEAVTVFLNATHNKCPVCHELMKRPNHRDDIYLKPTSM